MRREQKTVKTGWTCEGTVETESSKGARSVATPETAEKNGAGLLERILHRNNLNAAYKRIKRNGGAAGIDGMTVDEMLPYLQEHREELLERLRSGRYKPQAVRRVEMTGQRVGAGVAHMGKGVVERETGEIGCQHHLGAGFLV